MIYVSAGNYLHTHLCLLKMKLVICQCRVTYPIIPLITGCGQPTPNAAELIINSAMTLTRIKYVQPIIDSFSLFVRYPPINVPNAVDAMLLAPANANNEMRKM